MNGQLHAPAALHLEKESRMIGYRAVVDAVRKREITLRNRTQTFAHFVAYTGLSRIPMFFLHN
jgi:hypothetical protein